MKNSMQPMSVIAIIAACFFALSFSSAETRQEEIRKTQADGRPKAETTKTSGGANQEAATNPTAESLPTIDEARKRARLLHTAFNGVLQVMHRDFFEEDVSDIPSASLQDVFDDLAENQGVKLRWLGVNAKTLNLDHNPRDEFEKSAVKSLSSGKREFEAVEDQTYRYAGSIRLHNACLKCHVPNRTSLEDRTAGLVISLPIAKAPILKRQER